MRDSFAILLTTTVLAFAGCHTPPFQSAWQKPPSASDSNRPSRAGDDSPIEDDDAELADRTRSRSGFGTSAPRGSERSDADRELAAIARDLSRGHAAAARGEADQAAQAYRRVLDRAPQHAEAHHRLAVLADKQRDYATAERHYLSALERDPANPDLLNDLGYSYLLQARLDQAQRAFQEALRLDPLHRRAINNHGLVLARQGDYDGALAAFRRTHSEQDAQLNVSRFFPQGRPAEHHIAAVAPGYELQAPAPRPRGPAPQQAVAGTMMPATPPQHGLPPTAAPHLAARPAAVQSNGSSPLIIPAGGIAPPPQAVSYAQEAGFQNPSLQTAALPLQPAAYSSVGSHGAPPHQTAAHDPLASMPAWPPAHSPSAAVPQSALNQGVPFPPPTQPQTAAPMPGSLQHGPLGGNTAHFGGATSASNQPHSRDAIQQTAAVIGMNAGPGMIFPVLEPNPATMSGQPFGSTPPPGAGTSSQSATSGWTPPPSQTMYGTNAYDPRFPAGGNGGFVEPPPYRPSAPAAPAVSVPAFYGP